MPMQLGQFLPHEDYGDKPHKRYRFDTEIAKKVHEAEEKKKQKLKQNAESKKSR